MTRDDAEEAIVALGRAIVALGHETPDVVTAGTEATEALAIMLNVRSPYASSILRPGLNFHQGLQPIGSYADTQAAYEGKPNV